MRSAMRWQRYWKNIQSRYCIAPDLMSIVWEHRSRWKRVLSVRFNYSICQNVGIRLNSQLFHLSECRDQIEQSELYKRVKASSRRIDSVDELEKQGIIIHKIFLFTGDLEMLDKIKRRLMQNPELAVASSFYNNLEITVKGAEKGPAIQEYIESLGYTKEEVMVFGDSLNDYSMLSMDFGATVAMENADEEVKRVSKYVTKSNEDLGVAYTIHELLKKQGKINSNCE